MRIDARRQLAAKARVEALAREDKWYLSAGDGTIWAPPVPLWLARPGFWDPGHVYHYPLGPLFSVALVGDNGLSDPLHATGSHWRPDRLIVHWESRSGLVLTEFRYVLGGGRFCSAWRTEEELGWPNPVFSDKWLVAFSAAPGDDAWDVRRGESSLSWARRLTPGLRTVRRTIRRCSCGCTGTAANAPRLKRQWVTSSPTVSASAARS